MDVKEVSGKVNGVITKLPFIKSAKKNPRRGKDKSTPFEHTYPLHQLHSGRSRNRDTGRLFRWRGGAASANDFLYVLIDDYEQQESYEEIYGVIVSDGIKITGYTGKGGKVVIPATIEGYPITEIGDSVFAGGTDIAWDADRQRFVSTGVPFANNFITSITIPVSIKKIGIFCFANTSIISFVMSDSVTEVGAMFLKIVNYLPILGSQTTWR